MLTLLKQAATSVQPQKSIAVFITKYFVKTPFQSIIYIELFMWFSQFRSTFSTTLSVEIKIFQRKTKWNRNLQTNF